MFLTHLKNVSLRYFILKKCRMLNNVDLPYMSQNFLQWKIKWKPKSQKFKPPQCKNHMFSLSGGVMFVNLNQTDLICCLTEPTSLRTWSLIPNLDKFLHLSRKKFCTKKLSEDQRSSIGAFSQLFSCVLWCWQAFAYIYRIKTIPLQHRRTHILSLH